MKRSFIFIGMAAASCALPAVAQNLVDATRFSATGINGTARYRSMGGAFGALGGDPTSMNDNPAGIGIYRGTSEISITPDLSIARTTSHGEVDGKRKQRDFSIGNLSYVLSFKTSGCEHLVNFNIGLGFNHSEGTKRKYMLTKDSQPSSFGGYLANLTNNALLRTGNYGNPGYLQTNDAWGNGSRIPLLGLMAYDTYAIDDYEDANGNKCGVESYDQKEGLNPYSRLYVREENRTDEYNICASANWDDFIYAGFTMSIVDFNSTINSQFSEDYDFNYSGSYTDYNNDLETKGSGINLKFGAIIKPIDAWRLGLAVHTPTWYTMKDFYAGSMKTDAAEKWCDSGDGPYEYHYRFNSPWKYQFSTAYIFGTRAILSLEYDMDDYRSMRYKASWDEGWDDEDFSWQKRAIKDYMQEMHTIKVGGELRATKNFSIRAGFVHQTSPYKDEVFDNWRSWQGDEEVIYSSSTKPNYTLQDATNYVTGGFGYRGDGWYIDFACVHKTQYEKIGLFPTADAFMGYDNQGRDLGYSYKAEDGAVTGTMSSLKTKTLSFDVTLGFKF